jgi:hypothetical protein
VLCEKVFPRQAQVLTVAAWIDTLAYRKFPLSLRRAVAEQPGTSPGVDASELGTSRYCPRRTSALALGSGRTRSPAAPLSPTGPGERPAAP